MTILLKHHVVVCRCGHIQCTSAKKKATCKKCKKTWTFLPDSKASGGYIQGVLASYYRPQDAAEFCKNYKMMQAKAEELRKKGYEVREGER